MEDNTNGKNQTPITLDDLAVMVKRGFDDMDRKFDDMDRKFDDMDKKFEDLGTKIDTKPSQHHVDSRFRHLEETVITKTTEASITRDRTLDKKANTIAQKLGIKAILTHQEVTEIERITPFAMKPIAE